MKKVKEFESLLKSEIKKVERYANNYENRKDCRVTGYYTDNKIDSLGFLTVECEVCCNDMEDRVENVLIEVCLWDRRKSFAWGV